MSEPDCREAFLVALEEIYSRLPEAGGNPCGPCRACCSAGVMTSHGVSDLELDHLAYRVGEAEARSFADFAMRARDAEGRLRYETCPLHEGEGCRAHAHRPFSCRVFGHFRAAGTLLPEGCVFAGATREFALADFFAAVPGSRDLHRLKREYAFLRRPGPVRQVLPDGPGSLGEEDLVHLDPEDPLDRAARALVGGRPSESLAEARRALEEQGGTPAVLYALGVALEALRHPDLALQAFQAACGLVPECADFHYHAGYNLAQSRHFAGAAAALARAIELNPEHSLALGLLGYLLLLDRRVEEARRYLGLALAIDPGNPLFRNWLDRAAL